MPEPSNTERDHQKIGETILLCVRKLLAQSSKFGSAQVLTLGSLHEVAERKVTAALQAQVDRVQYIRAFRREEEVGLWESRFGAVLPEGQARSLHLTKMCWLKVSGSVSSIS
jgi:hypothetical protein